MPFSRQFVTAKPRYPPLRRPGRWPHRAFGPLFQRFAGALGRGADRESPPSNSKRAFLFLGFPFWDLSFLALIFSRIPTNWPAVGDGWTAAAVQAKSSGRR